MEPALSDLYFTETERFHISPLTSAHVDQLYRITDFDINLAEIAWFNTTVTKDSILNLLSIFTGESGIYWGVWPLVSFDLAGAIGAHFRGKGRIEIDYWFSPSVQRRGYASEAVHCVVEELRRVYPARVVYAETSLRNVASVRLLRRLGFDESDLDDGAMGKKKFVYNPPIKS